MFSSIKFKILLIIYLLIIFSIPTGAYLLYQRQKTDTDTTVTPTPVTKPPKEAQESLTDKIKKITEEKSQGTSSATPASSSSFSLGPVINFTVTLEGRSSSNQAGQLFVGISEGEPRQNPNYILSFIIDLPASGAYNNL